MSRTKQRARRGGKPIGKRSLGEDGSERPTKQQKHDPDGTPNDEVSSTSQQVSSGAPAIFISGAASGLGRSLVMAYAKLIQTEPPAPLTKASRIYALDMPGKCTPSKIEKLFGFTPDDVDWMMTHVVPMSCNIQDGNRLERIVSEIPDDIALAIHSVGIRGLVPGLPVNKYSDVAEAENLEVMTSKTMAHTFQINTIGTFLALRALLPALKKHIITNGTNPEAPPPKVVVMGSRMGSIGHNTSQGGAYAYRASKAALNAVVKSFSVDVPEVVYTIVHPGRVESKLVPIKEDDAIPVETAVADLVPLIQSLGKSDTGRFLDRFGADIVW